MTKPVARTELLDTIARALGTAPAPRGCRATASSPAVPRRALRILLAEDNLVNQRVAIRLLEKDGHSVTAVVNGVEAVAETEAGGFDLVFMDVQMPELDGLEATRLIRAAGRRVPIIAMTAHAFKGDEERCLAAGMDAYVSKPVSAARLREAVASVLSRDADDQASRPCA